MQRRFMEKTEFVSIDGKDIHNQGSQAGVEKDQYETILKAEQAKANVGKAGNDQNLDFEALVNANKTEESPDKSVSNDNLDFEALLKQNKE